MYDALEIAKYVITYCYKKNKPINNLFLQRIIYCIQKRFLKEKKLLAFKNEIQAWAFGPVIPDVYYFFCGYGAMNIEKAYMNIKKFKIDDKNLINSEIDNKINLDLLELLNEPYHKDTAWYKTYDCGKGNRKTLTPQMIYNEK